MDILLIVKENIYFQTSRLQGADLGIDKIYVIKIYVDCVNHNFNRGHLALETVTFATMYYPPL